MDPLLLYGYTLVIGEQVWRVEAGDQAAVPIVVQLADAMKLDSIDHADRLGLPTRWVRVITRDDAVPANGALVCALKNLNGDDALFCHLLDLSLFIARDAQAHGCVLLHGALAERAGKGVILAAPGGIGKTTASNRLPSPWVSLCDDMTLVRRDANGVYWAHPWPTWSTFLWGGKGGSWNVQSAVPLDRIYFLTRDAHDRAEPLGTGHALVMLVESAQQIAQAMERGTSDADKRALRLERFELLCAMAKAILAHRLHLSLTGAFWEHLG